ncbi:ATP-binding protein [Streptomyces sp. NPDC059224]|uniref:ATP-binding protein n=1 Tax=Streptomyces sp. NPDC059224 TaxID=3346775 RepID=UPI0036AF5330
MLWALLCHSRLDIQIQPDDFAAVHTARRAVARQALAWGLTPVSDDAILLVSELVTNALEHSMGPASLAVIPLKCGVRVEVRDTLTSLPVRRSESSDATSGRGLLVVEALANSWGVETHGTGKRVWCEIYAQSSEHGDTSLSRRTSTHRPPAKP